MTTLATIPEVFTDAPGVNMTLATEDDDYLAHGHLDPVEFIAELRRYQQVVGAGLRDHRLQAQLDAGCPDVRHVWVVVTGDDETVVFGWVTEETPGAVPATWLDYGGLT